MKVFRLCNIDEQELILNQRGFLNTGCECEIYPNINTHKYIPGKKYLHFFEKEISILYLFPEEGTFVCVYDIPEDILEQAKGTGFYLDFINYTDLHQITEYAIESDKINFKHLKKVYVVKSTLDFDYLPSLKEIYTNLNLVYTA